MPAAWYQWNNLEATCDYFQTRKKRNLKIIQRRENRGVSFCLVLFARTLPHGCRIEVTCGSRWAALTCLALEQDPQSGTWSARRSCRKEACAERSEAAPALGCRPPDRESGTARLWAGKQSLAESLNREKKQKETQKLQSLKKKYSHLLKYFTFCLWCHCILLGSNYVGMFVKWKTNYTWFSFLCFLPTYSWKE